MNDDEALQRLLHAADRTARPAAAAPTTADIARIARAARERSPEGGERLRSPLRRRLLPAGLAAAAALLAASVVAVLLATPDARAAARWREVVETTRAYRGWVHATSTFELAPEPATQPATSPPATTAPAAPAAQPARVRPTLLVTHWNTADDTVVRETHLGGRRYLDMKIPAQRLWYFYDPEADELRIGETSDLLAASFAEQVRDTPVTLGEWLDRFAGPGRPPAVTTQSRDGDLIRFDLTEAGSGPQATEPWARLWVDPATKLIRKSWLQTPHGPMASEYSYGAPAFRDVYDAGVPRATKVVDGRPPPDAAQVAARLHDRAEKGYGDGVALLTQESYMPGDAGKPNPWGRAMTLFARKGDKVVRAVYHLSPGGEQRQLALVPPPASWPTPSLDEVLAAVRNGVPVTLDVVNGTRTWTGGSTSDYQSFQWRGRGGEPEQNRYLHGAGTVVWPPREYSAIGLPGLQARLIVDDARPGLIGLQCDYGGGFEPAQPELPNRRMIYWIDPARDDMPVETLDIQAADAKGEPRDFMRTQFTDHAQLPDGRWYPTRWEWENFEDGAPMANVQKSVFRLSVVPDARPDDAWFTGPGDNPLVADVGAPR
jgi:hypothetical protein